ncbi:magnesium transporter [Halonatronum saccharophilum]|uniref:magnesium transporter n=1 Tax=Halonatronum saccharophilum TaxID=150060 RepID=UPI0004B008D9|nr:magnesium transporter [Halonatronum saccharophilum]
MEERVLIEIKEALETKDEKRVVELVEDLYPADIAELIDELSTEDIQVLIPIIPLEKLAFSLAELDFDTKHNLLKLLDADKLKVILDTMYSDDIADLLGTLSIGKSKELLNLMKKDDAAKIQNLLGYKEDSAGGIMTTEYIAIKAEKTAAETIEKLRDIAPKVEMIYYIYVVSKTKELRGVLSMRDLLTAAPDQKVEDLMQPNVIKVNLKMDQEDVASIISKYDLLAIPVVSEKNQLLGVITVDDIIDVIEEEATEDMYKMAGTSEVEVGIHGKGIVHGAMKRLPWLIILLFASLLSGGVIGGFEEELESVVALAFFIPVLMDTGGNAGTQSLTVAIRGLATGDLDRKEIRGHVLNEMKVGLLVAIVCGVMISLIATVWQGSPVLGLVVGTAMFATLIVAVLSGTTLPFIIDALGADPAVAAGPFITTLVDVSGLLIYFSLAKALIEQLA